MSNRTTWTEFSLKTVLIFLVLAVPLIAAEPWPLDSDWVGLLGYDWNNLADAPDIPNCYADVVVDDNGYAAYFWTTETTIYFRLVLECTPIKVDPDNLWQFAWFVAFDVDEDNSPDWATMVGGISEVLTIAYNTGIDDDPETVVYSVADPLISGEVRVANAGWATFPGATYLDWQIPYSELIVPGYDRNITPTTSLRMILTTSSNEQLSVKDAAGSSTTLSGAFASSSTITLGNPGSFGSIYDSRDPDPLNDLGVWYRGETLTVDGKGWPPSGSSYYNGGNLNLQILDALQTIVWSGTITYDANGDLATVPAWPIDNTPGPGIYVITVEDPRNPGIWLSYDTFTISAPVMHIAKVVSPDSVDSGSNITYTISIWNSGDAAGNLVSVIDNLPTGFNYIPGSTSGLTTADPSINGQKIDWSGTWPIAIAGQPADSVTLSFSVNVGTLRGLHNNFASAGGSNFNLITTGNAAPVQVLGPSLVLSKIVDSATANPGSVLTYTIVFSNIGDGAAIAIYILETIPVNTTYIENSVSGSNLILQYSHDNGASYDASQTAPVTSLSFQRTIPLAPGESGTVSFQVTVD